MSDTPTHASLEARHFECRRLEMPDLQPGEALVRVKLINIHSATRLRMAQGITAQGQTDPRNYACAEVVLSRDPAFEPGDIVACQAGWQEYQVIRSRDLPIGFNEPSELVKALNGTCSPWTYVFRPAMVRMWSPSILMEIFGTSGMVAYFGMQQNGPLMPRDAVAVAATTGAVGSIFAQLAKAAGCRVVGFAGGHDRCRWVVENLGVDDCLDYRSTNLPDQLVAAFPDGIDVFSDGVGGPLTELVTANMNRHGRLLSYGAAAAAYGEAAPSHQQSSASIRRHYGISEQVEATLRERHIKSDAWTVDTFYHNRIRAEDDLSLMLLRGCIRPHANVINGFEQLPQAIVDLYSKPRAGKLQISFE